jgi:hypothetical protein
MVLHDSLVRVTSNLLMPYLSIDKRPEKNTVLWKARIQRIAFRKKIKW